MKLGFCQINVVDTHSRSNRKLTTERFSHNLQCHGFRGMTEAFLFTANEFFHEKATFQFCGSWLFHAAFWLIEGSVLDS